MTEKTPPRYWSRWIGDDGKWRQDDRIPPGEDLAVLRTGLNRPAGSAIALVPFYTCPIDDYLARRGKVSDEQVAEHVALSLFGLHQQGHRSPMHKPGLSIGRALRRLRQSGKFGEEALDRRVTATVNTTSVSAFAYRLRGLVEQLRSQAIPVDYDLLLRDVHYWHRSDGRHLVRRYWGLAYFDWSSTPKENGQDASP